MFCNMVSLKTWTMGIISFIFITNKKQRQKQTKNIQSLVLSFLQDFSIQTRLLSSYLMILCNSFHFSYV